MRFGHKLCIGLDKQDRDDAHAKSMLLTVSESMLNKGHKNFLRFLN